MSYVLCLSEENKMGLGKVFFFGQMDRRMDECWGLEARGLRLEATKNKKPIPFDPAIFFSFFFFLFFFPPRLPGYLIPFDPTTFPTTKKLVVCFAFLFSFLFCSHSLYMRKESVASCAPDNIFLWTVSVENRIRLHTENEPVDAFELMLKNTP